jgi:multidrug efflux pump subunit AcrA (membrane-fusion protein)
MSTAEQHVDPELVEETKQQIRVLVNEIAQLAQSDVSELEFYDGFLNRVITALAAHGGVVWRIEESGRLAVEYQVNLQETGLFQSEENQRAHGRLLHKFMREDEIRLVAPHSGAGDGEQEGANPTNYLLVLGILRADQEIIGLVEIFQRSGAAPAVQKGYERFLLQMCDLAGDFLKTRSLRKFTDRQALWNQLEGFTRAVHFSLDPRRTAYAIANEGRRLIECDRVTVAVLKGGKCKVESVSGQDTFDKRANTVTLLQKLATAVVRQGDPVWYTGDTTDMPPQVEDALQAYVDESHSKTVAILPLKRPRIEDESVAADDREPEEVVGALVIEQIEDAQVRDATRQRIDVVTQHSAAALANAVEHNNLFLMPLWRAIGKATWVVRARTLPKTLSIVAAVASVILGLCLIPADYTLVAKGELQPQIRSEVFAPSRGTIKRVEKDHGDWVEEGEVLLVMEYPELDRQLEDINGQLKTIRQQWHRIRAELSQREVQRDRVERVRLEGELAEANERSKSLQRQLEILNKEMAKLEVRSPISGQILSWDVKDMLRTRPVEPGQIVMTIANPKGEWELELKMAEDRMGDIGEAMGEALETSGSTELKVEYTLATDPKTDYVGKIHTVEKRTEPQGEGGAAVKIVVRNVDKMAIAANTELLPGAGVIGRVDCGRKPIGYVWFHDLINWIYKFFFKLAG